MLTKTVSVQKNNVYYGIKIKDIQVSETNVEEYTQSSKNIKRTISMGISWLKDWKI